MIKITKGKSESTRGLFRAYCTEDGWHSAWEGAEGDAAGWGEDHLAGSGMDRCRGVTCETWTADNLKRAKCTCNYHCTGCERYMTGRCCSCCTLLLSVAIKEGKRRDIDAKIAKYRAELERLEGLK